MLNIDLYTKISSLPLNLQKDVSDYIESLVQKENIKIEKQPRKAGCMAGIFKMSENFNDPINDFEEYM